MLTSLLLISGIILVIAALAAIALSLHVGFKLIKPPRKPLDMEPGEYGIEVYENIRFPSRDGLVQLAGWYFAAEENNRTALNMTLVLAHGYSQNRLEPHLPALSLAASLVEAGFDVLMFDFRNAGLSEGQATTVGYWEKQDLLGAIDFAANKNPNNRIGLIGFSMGAATAVLAAAEEPRVTAVVADSPFDSLHDYLKVNLTRWTGLPRLPFSWLIMRILPFLVKADIAKVNPLQAVERVMPRPILLIHGMDDQTTPHTNSLQLYEKARSANAELWLVEDAGHVKSYAKSPAEYTDRVIRFFHRVRNK